MNLQIFIFNQTLVALMLASYKRQDEADDPVVTAHERSYRQGLKDLLKIITPRGESEA